MLRHGTAHCAGRPLLTCELGAGQQVVHGVDGNRRRRSSRAAVGLAVVVVIGVAASCTLLARWLWRRLALDLPGRRNDLSGATRSPLLSLSAQDTQQLTLLNFSSITASRAGFSSLKSDSSDGPTKMRSTPRKFTVAPRTAGCTAACF